VFLWAVVTSSKGEDHRVFALQLAARPQGVRVIRQSVIGEYGAGNDVRSHMRLLRQRSYTGPFDTAAETNDVALLVHSSYGTRLGRPLARRMRVRRVTVHQTLVSDRPSRNRVDTFV
jgi:hypothetical protein